MTPVGKNLNGMRKMKLIRVTHVLDSWKEQWYVDWVCKVGKREANRIGKAAMKIGTRVDELIKSGKPFPVKKDSVEVNNCINAFLKWKQVYQPESIESCTRLYSTIEGYDVTGEPDLIVDGVLVDIKCAAKISPKYWIQVCMYQYLRDVFVVKDGSLKVGILRLDKNTGSFEYVVKDYNPSLVTVWIGMMRAMLYLQGDSDDSDNGSVDV